ncbi:MAG: NTF2 fold immunity protein [Candidatus Acidiferrales bacterium]
MKIIAAWFLLTSSVFAGGIGVVRSMKPTQTFVPKNGFVPDKETAIRVAEAVLIPIYGEKQITSERPLSAELKDGIWIVSGHMPLGMNGGAAEIRISKKTCRVISVIHGK